MKVLAKFLALAAIAITATSALPTTTDTNLVARQPSDPPWCKPCPPGKYCQCDSNLQCFPITGTGVFADYYTPAIETFCTRFNGASLSTNSAFREVYSIPPGTDNTVALSLTNPFCDADAYFDYEGCVPTFYNILLGCNTGESPHKKNVGGTYMYGCGHYMLQHSGPGI
ncbi:hypothetical protein M409DRAFT_16690 [Zasmidium cellare ATCC 36951]|uniref:Uncharacterized protein n=1 Tax=Zasmidium cellare ATCC 36951 TaxID=1080233 RepID=A0A6A6D3L8_ZASCE|nr:uncharacterized protein M409DRAFT_16690 [Zasmidium cellare ATCC 36951]KAF2172729.1 hypothetical protein M409DRAFT_16690 [Zasmidium cellare ATCC 36951]